MVCGNCRLNEGNSHQGSYKCAFIDANINKNIIGQFGNFI